jgi:hypothetical protein
VKEWRDRGSRTDDPKRWWGVQTVNENGNGHSRRASSGPSNAQGNNADATAQRTSESSRTPIFNPFCNPFAIGHFIGQGRRIQFCGLSWAVMEEVGPLRRLFEPDEPGAAQLPPLAPPAHYDTCARRVRERLGKRPPSSWYVTAIVGLILVWVSIGMAILLAYSTPTIGIGCWSGSFLIYGALSSISWAVQFFDSRHTIARRFCNTVNFIAFCWLVTITFLMVSAITFFTLFERNLSDARLGHRRDKHLLV